MTATDLAAAAFEEAWARFREEREARVAAPFGFLAVTGLHWLRAQPQRFEDVPGAWSSRPEGVVVTLAEGERLELAGAPLAGRTVIGRVDEDGVAAEFVAPDGSRAMVEIAQRSGISFLRPRHPGNPARAEYRGTPTFPPSPRWRVPGRFEAYPVPRPIGVDTVVEGMESVLDAVGEVTFEVEGRTQRLVAFSDGDEADGGTHGGLWILFTDETSGVTTYAATRQLSVEPPAADGGCVLDFNRAVNMPCAYTPYATCPLPPLGNHVDVLVEAGEQTPPQA